MASSIYRPPTGAPKTAYAYNQDPVSPPVPGARYDTVTGRWIDESGNPIDVPADTPTPTSPYPTPITPNGPGSGTPQPSDPQPAPGTPAPTAPTTPTPASGTTSNIPVPTSKDDQTVAKYLQQLIASGMAPQQAIDKANADLGLVYGSSPAYYPDRNMIGLTSLVMEGNNGWNYYLRGNSATQQPAPTTPATPATPVPTPPPPDGGTGGGGGGGTSAAASPIGGVSDTQSKSDALYQALLDRSKQSLKVDPNDPIIQAQLQPFTAMQQQQARNAEAAMAERQGPYGNMDAETRYANEQVGQNTSAFQGQLLQGELSARRQEIQDALTSMQAFLTDEQKMALQKQLAELDNALEYARLHETGREFDASLGQRAYEFDTTNRNNILGA